MASAIGRLEYRQEIAMAGVRKRSKKCPMCGTTATAAFAPFCSARCRDLDLANWLGGNYRIPVVEEESGLEEADDEAEASSRVLN